MSSPIPLAPGDLVYVASPYRGSGAPGEYERNERRARMYARFVAMLGVVPFVPHLYLTTFLDDRDPDDRALGIELGIDALQKCRIVMAFLPYGQLFSEGMRLEREKADQLGIPWQQCDELTATQLAAMADAGIAFHPGLLSISGQYVAMETP